MPHWRKIGNQTAGRPKPNRKPGAFRTGAPSVLMSRTVNQRLQLDAAPEKKRTDALGGIELVPGQAQEIDAQNGDPCRNLADCLRGVGMEKDRALPRDAPDLGERLNGADFVVGVHNANSSSVAPSYAGT